MLASMAVVVAELPMGQQVRDAETAVTQLQGQGGTAGVRDKGGSATQLVKQGSDRLLKCALPILQDQSTNARKEYC